MSRLSALRVEAEAKCEAARVLPHLRQGSRFLGPDQEDGFAVFARELSPARRVVTTSEVFVRSWLRSELIELSPNPILNRETGGSAFVLTPIGHAFVARTGGESFGAQHRLLLSAREHVEGDVTPELNACESPLAWLRLRRDSAGQPHISEFEFRAGERLREDFTLAMMMPRASASWPLERVDCSRRAGYSPTLESERALTARARFWAALDSVGEELAVVLVGVCCHLEGLAAIEARLELPKRSAKTVLRLGLRALARHYGLVANMGREKLCFGAKREMPAE